MSRRTKIVGFGSIDTEQATKLFVKGAETTMDLAASARDYAERGDCANASRFALRAAEEMGSVRGVMSQLAAEAGKTNDPNLNKMLNLMREDFDVMQEARNQAFASFIKRCACSVPGALPPVQITTRPSDGEEDG